MTIMTMLFITVAWYPRLSKSCKQNSKFDGTLPSQAQQHLCKTWSCIRAQLKRDGIDIYGFRVAEPHHDGTPHWHLLVFLPAHRLASLQSTFMHYAMQEDRDEAGADKHRVKWEYIDKAKAVLLATLRNTSQKTSTAMSLTATPAAKILKAQPNVYWHGQQLGASANSSNSVVRL